MDALLKTVTDVACAIRDRVLPAVDDVEVLVSCADSTGYSVENDQVIASLTCGSWSVAMRAMKGGRVATAATTSRDPGESADALTRALGAAQAQELAGFLSPREGTDLRRADAATWALVDDPAALRAMAVAMRDGAWAQRKGVVVEGEVSASRSRRALVTGRGGPLTSAETYHGAFVMLDGNDWDATSSRAPRSEAVPTLGSALAASLPAREVTVAEFLGGPREVDAVLHPRMLEGLLRALLLERVGLDRVLAGISPAKLGDALAHPRFELWDDTGALSLAGHASDDEGMEGARKAILRAGVLTTLLADQRSALRAGTAPTGNGFRIPILAEDRAEAPVRVGMGHLEVPAGDIPREALTRGRALLIPDLLGVHSANKSTGAFNNPIVGGLALEDGVPVARLKAGAWSATGSFYDILKGAERLSRERMDTGSATLPWLAARVRVA